MSSQYNTEPPPTASATLHTTAGDIHISLFAKQTPLACKNFLQHCLDGYYVGTTFHRIVPGFVVQAGDPTGTGSGGSSIYEDPEFEFDYSRDSVNGERVVFGDEIHSRLKFNRRGLVGMAKSEDAGGKGTNQYGSQFFVTLGPADRELTGKYTMFGRLEGDSIYNIVKIAEGELVEGTERPAFAVKITGSEVHDLGPYKDVLRKREKVATTTVTSGREAGAGKKKKKKKQQQKGGKALLSFGGDDEGDAEPAIALKPKFNTRLVADNSNSMSPKSQAGKTKVASEEEQQNSSLTRSLPTRPSEKSRGSGISRKRSRSPERSHTPPPLLLKPPRDPNTQLPLPKDESPKFSPPPSPPPAASLLSQTNAEIAALKASMRRDTSSATTEPPRKKTALESLIPETSIRGRKRPPPGSNFAAPPNGFKQEDEALRVFNAFKSKLENAALDSSHASTSRKKSGTTSRRSRRGEGGDTVLPAMDNNTEEKAGGDEDEEANVCDLHFIANCQSCQVWDELPSDIAAANEGQPAYGDEEEAGDWMSHRLTFGKDTLGKDLNWKRQHEDVDGLVVIDPRQKEKEIIGGRKREKERKRKLEGGGGREWDQRGRGNR